MRRKLHSLKLKEGDSVQDHIKQMTEIFNALSVMDAPLSEEDRVIYLLASLPESFGVLVTALEASSTVPTLDVVTEKLLHEERKQREKEESSSSHDEKAMVMPPRRFYGHCYHCGKQGHLKRDCQALRAEGAKGKRKHEVHKAAQEDHECDALIVGHEALQVGVGTSWIVDSGATCHMCNNHSMFVEYENRDERVTLGDGRWLNASGRGTVELMMKLPEGKRRRCRHHDVLFVPGLSYNLLSVSRVSKMGKMANFGESGCQIIDSENKLIACALKYEVFTSWNTSFMSRQTLFSQ